MRKLYAFILVVAFCLNTSAQSEEEYEKNIVFTWETDSVYLREDYVGKTSFNPNMIDVDFRANKYYGVLTVTNHSDAPFDMSWDYIHISLNGDISNYYKIDKPVVYDQEKQIENVPRNGRAYQQINNCFANQFYYMKDIKKNLKNESHVPVTLVINFAIIYKGEEVMIEVKKQGICKKK